MQYEGERLVWDGIVGVGSLRAIAKQEGERLSRSRIATLLRYFICPVPFLVLYLRPMSDSKTIQIDLKGWITQAEYARQYNYKLNTISKWLKRAKEGEGSTKIQY